MAGEVPENVRELMYGALLAVIGAAATLAVFDPWFRLRARLWIDTLLQAWDEADPDERVAKALALRVKRDAPGVVARAEELLAAPEDTLREIEEGGTA